MRAFKTAAENICGFEERRLGGDDIMQVASGVGNNACLTLPIWRDILRGRAFWCWGMRTALFANRWTWKGDEKLADAQ